MDSIIFFVFSVVVCVSVCEVWICVNLIVCVRLCLYFSVVVISFRNRLFVFVIDIDRCGVGCWLMLLGLRMMFFSIFVVVFLRL